jgi:acyl-CoA synthetase (NDP forming)
MCWQSRSWKRYLLDKRCRIAGLRPFFEPESVAVIGASRSPGKGGYNIIENLLRLGYAGQVYPINPRAKEILGLPSYPGLKQTPARPELALIVLPPSLVLASVQECIEAGIKAVIIESAGFAEMDASGARMEKRLARMAGEAGVRIMGPNSVGTMNPYACFDSSLGRLNELFLPEGDIRRGSVGFIGQTGLFTGVYLPLINSELGISKVACLGNKCDVDESDMLEYFGDDPRTKVITMYLESISDGQRFMRLSRRIIEDKPIIVVKSAVTRRGARASATHTGSIAGEDHIYDAAFRQTGIIRVDNFERLWDAARALVMAKRPPGDRVAVINLAGSGCVTAADACVRHGLRIAELSPSTREKIKTVYPDWWHVRNPVDVWVAIEASGFKAAYLTATRAVLEDGGVDAAVVILGAIDWMAGEDVPALFAGINKDFPDKPVLAVCPLGDREVYLKLHQGFQDIGIPCYTRDEAAIAALAILYHYRQSATGTD